MPKVRNKTLIHVHIWSLTLPLAFLEPVHVKVLPASDSGPHNCLSHRVGITVATRTTILKITKPIWCSVGDGIEREAEREGGGGWRREREKERERQMKFLDINIFHYTKITFVCACVRMSGRWPEAIRPDLRFLVSLYILRALQQTAHWHGWLWPQQRLKWAASKWQNLYT